MTETPRHSPARPEPSYSDRSRHGPSHRRPLDRRRRVREQVLLLLVFLIALGVTVFLLANQWLLSAPTTGAIATPGSGVLPPLPTPGFTS